MVRLLYIDVMAMIKNAKSLEEKPASKKASKKEEFVVEQLSELAKLDALIKSLVAMKQVAEQNVKTAAFNKLIENARVTHKKADSIRGIEGKASASLEMRKRSTASKLSEEEVSYLTSNGYPVEKVVITPKLFAINPKFAADEALMERVEVAMENALKDIVDTENFFIIQNEVSKNVVSDDTIESVFKASTIDPEAVAMTTCMAVKPKIDGFDFEEALKSVLGSCESVEEEAEENAKAA
jgi:hypothetical protein